jgi:ribosome-associated toxin RatA of RatAB toxin-antitoxin module
VTFRLQYELALRAEALAGRFIERAADRMVDAFVLRAESVYATPPVAGESPADAST